MKWHILPLLLSLSLIACGETSPTAEEPKPEMAADTSATVGSIERLSTELDALIAPDAQLEILAEGFNWSEGPLWLPEQQMLIFSDVPENTIYQWKEGDTASVYLYPSGYTQYARRGGEPGSNGLLLDAQGRLVLCQHGDRRVAYMSAPLDQPVPTFVTLAGQWEGKKFNSPNDAAYHPNGSLYFTDPPYGLAEGPDDPAREIDFQGVYRLDPAGEVTLMTDELSRPNGIAFSPDGNTAYVANSDPQRAIWMAYDVDQNGEFTNGRVFLDVTDRVGQEQGLPDGLKVSRSGHLFATGPGGVLVLTADGRQLGLIRTGQATANCAFDTEERYLYITADGYLMRVEMGAGS